MIWNLWFMLGRRVNKFFRFCIFCDFFAYFISDTRFVFFTQKLSENYILATISKSILYVFLRLATPVRIASPR